MIGMHAGAPRRAPTVLQVLLACLAAALIGGCGGEDHSGPATPAGRAAASQPVARPLTVRASYPSPRSHALDLAAASANGKLLVQAQCACGHALPGAGIERGPNQAGPPPDHMGTSHVLPQLNAVLVNACLSGCASQGSQGNKETCVFLVAAGGFEPPTNGL